MSGHLEEIEVVQNFKRSAPEVLLRMTISILNVSEKRNP